ncbi:Platelet-activating factor acetylhydrolase IB subunit gamma [Orchesella cincta]|uniref:Platelet-activating factor acetylhydrolase IB subunit gamma n=1 Tax=Orchesella cincta TaxID=48709 RepID=A0A1D2MK31_ORCCI|nr:Platelet-activating factor acetylhydrolase IB subunit gamma [Orchesella cincta]
MKFLLAFQTLFVLGIWIVPTLAQNPWTPQIRNEQWLFFSRKLANEGRPVWEANYAPLGAINYGLGGIELSMFCGVLQTVVVVYIGSNNVPVNTVDDIVRGVNTVVDKIHEKLPNTNILLVGTFPRADQPDLSGTLRKIRDIDEKLEALVGGDTQRRGHFFDLFWFLAPSSLDRIYEHLYVGDKLHLNTDGYQVWQRER